MLVWASRKGAGASYAEFQPSPFLRSLWALTKLCLRLALIAFCVVFIYVVVSGG